jgi:MFS_1 like family
VADAAPPLNNDRALRGLAAAYFLSFASGGIQLPLLALAMEHAGYPPTTIGAMWAARSLTGALLPVVWGMWADRLGSARPLVMLCLSMGAALLLLLSTSPSDSWCVLIFALYGALAQPGGSMMDGMTLTALGPERQSQFGRWRACGTIGFGVSTVTTTLLLDSGHLQPSPGSLLPLCALLMGGAVLAVATVPRIPRPPWTDPRLLLPALRQPILWGLVGVGTLLWSSQSQRWRSLLGPDDVAHGLLHRCDWLDHCSSRGGGGDRYGRSTHCAATAGGKDHHRRCGDLGHCALAAQHPDRRCPVVCARPSEPWPHLWAVFRGHHRFGCGADAGGAAAIVTRVVVVVVIWVGWLCGLVVVWPSHGSLHRGVIGLANDGSFVGAGGGGGTWLAALVVSALDGRGGFVRVWSAVDSWPSG